MLKNSYSPRNMLILSDPSPFFNNFLTWFLSDNTLSYILPEDFYFICSQIQNLTYALATEHCSDIYDNTKSTLK